MIEDKGTFLGRPMAQTREAVRMWEIILSSLDFARLIELGTGRGNLSLFFALYCVSRSRAFHTFDNAKRWVEDPTTSRVDLEWCFTEVNVFSRMGSDIVKGHLQREGQAVLFCDNGHKTKEVKWFAPHMKAGDVIAIHDWGTECKFKDVSETLLGWEKYLPEAWDGSTAVFQKGELDGSQRDCNKPVELPDIGGEVVEPERADDKPSPG